MVNLTDVETFIKAHHGVATVVGAALAGAIATKLVPYVWQLLGKLLTFFRTLLSGTRSSADFEKKYLSATINTHRALRLPGVTTSNTSRPPELEEVFISLTLDEPQNSLTMERLWDLLAKAGISQQAFAEMQLKRETGASAKELLRVVVETGEFSKMRKDLESNTLSETVKEAVRTLVSLYEVHFQSKSGRAQIESVLHSRARVAILGKPGSGKTTLLQYLALTYARERVRDPKARIRGVVKKRLGSRAWRVPIFVALSRVSKMLARPDSSGRRPTLLEAVYDSLPPDLRQHPAAQDYLRERLEKGECLLLLDGLDEVPTQEEFEAVTEAVQSAVTYYPDNQFLITSRVAGWRTGVGPEFLINYVNDLSATEVDSFVDIWCLAVEQNSGLAAKAASNAATTAATDLKRAIHENDRIGDLATNPLLLSIVALVHRSLGILPRDRTKLYAESVKLFLELWDIKRGVRINDTGLTLDQKDALMRAIAYAMHSGRIGESGGSRQASRADLVKEVQRLLPSFGKENTDADQLLQNLADRSGLLVERSVGSFVFSHLTFQEYFTANWLSHEPSGKAVAFLTDPERVLSDWWQEVVLLYSALIPDSSHLIKAICKSAESDDLCAQHLRLACLCTGECVSLTDSTLRDWIMRRLAWVRARRQSVQFAFLPAAVSDYLLRWCKGPEWYDAAAEANLVALQGDTTERAAGLVIEALASHRWTVRKAAVRAVAELGLSLSESSRAKVISFLDDGHPSVRLAALELLAKTEREPNATDPSLGGRIVSLLSDPSDEIKVVAASLQLDSSSIKPVLSEYTQTLIALSSDKDYGIREAAYKSLRRLSEHGADAIVQAVKSQPAGVTLKPQNPKVFELVASLDNTLVLSEIPAIVENLYSSVYDVYSPAMEKLSAPHPLLARAVADLIRPRLSNPWHVKSAVGALDRCGSAVHQELEVELLNLAKSWRPGIRAGAASCLARLTSDAAVSALADLIHDPSSKVRAAVASDVGRHNMDAAAFKVFNAALCDRSDRVVGSALSRYVFVSRETASEAMKSFKPIVERCLENPTYLKGSSGYYSDLGRNLLWSIAWAWKFDYAQDVEVLLMRAAGSKNFSRVSRISIVAKLSDGYASQGRSDKFEEVCVLLKSIFEGDTSPGYVAFGEVESLSLLAPEKISSQVNQLLECTVPEARREAASLLANAVPLLSGVALRALADEDATVRLFAVLSVLKYSRKHAVPKDVSERVWGLHNDVDPDVRKLAWDTFCSITQSQNEAMMQHPVS